jgi:redox-sensing transcriptional repressor
MVRGRGAGAKDPPTPRAAVGRLSLYLRHLDSLLGAGQTTVSSRELGRALQLTDAQVRKDLGYFGQFGYPGLGYRVSELRAALRQVLGTDRRWRAALIGVGNLGRALLGYRGFTERGFAIVAAFDVAPSIIGQTVGGLQVRAIDRLADDTQTEQIELAILAVPADAAQQVAERVVAAGLIGILNFAPVQLKVPKSVQAVSVDLGLQLEQLLFQVHQRTLGAKGSE